MIAYSRRTLLRRCLALPALLVCAPEVLRLIGRADGLEAASSLPPSRRVGPTCFDLPAETVSGRYAVTIDGKPGAGLLGGLKRQLHQLRRHGTGDGDRPVAGGRLLGRGRGGASPGPRNQAHDQGKHPQLSSNRTGQAFRGANGNPAPAR